MSTKFVAYVRMPRSFGSQHRSEFDTVGDAQAYADIMRRTFKATVTVVTAANAVAREGCDRCYCGCKYWEGDRCIDCHTHVMDCLRDPEWVKANR